MSSLVPIPANDNVDINLAYASPSNVTSHCLYDSDRAKAYLHKDAIPLLDKAIALAAQQNYRLRILDAFRPTETQWALWHFFPDERFVAHPERGSPHSRGVALDVTLVDGQGVALDMGTDFDDFTPRSYHGALSLSQQAQANRYCLLGIMVSAGWDFYIHEWWHYQLFNSKRYPLHSDKAIEGGMVAQDARKYVPHKMAHASSKERR
ncbi:MAG: D-alanyl-D-alanine dipeptidase [Alphaproteobacteria bacterium GM7ARS4]|nr:D-alanyl-D-alanine dipeptidase [Alphaproteobacteria bacterium GM7ARS4]